jgi:phage gp46-like protein
MATDIRYLQQLDFPAYAVQLDWLLSPLNLVEDGYDLQSAVIIALGTDAYAPPSEELPDIDSTDRRGWWGDLDADLIWGGWPVGCLLWLLTRAKITDANARQGSTLTRIDSWTRDAMRPFTDRLIASQIDVQPSLGLPNYQRIDAGITIYRGPESAISLRYAELWDDLKNQTLLEG